MQYSKNQYDLIEKLSEGLLWTSLSDAELETLHYLEHESIARPREDLKPDFWTLDHKGERVLEEYRNNLEAIQNRALESQNKKAEAKAEKEADRRIEHKFQWKLSFANIALGALVSNLDRIIKFFIDLFS